jgi:hypothetical protein
MGWSPVQGVLPTASKIHSCRINFEWEQSRGRTTPKEEEEEKAITRLQASGNLLSSLCDNFPFY